MTWRVRPRGQRDRGFTLIEVMAVLAILGMALSIVARSGPSRSAALDLHGTADGIVGGLRLARAQAIAGNVAVPFTIGPGGYRTGAGRTNPLPEGVMAVLVAPEAAGQIVFTPDGGSAGGEVRVASRAGARTVRVGWLSGRVTADAKP